MIREEHDFLFWLLGSASRPVENSIILSSIPKSVPECKMLASDWFEEKMPITIDIFGRTPIDPPIKFTMYPGENTADAIERTAWERGIFLNAETRQKIRKMQAEVDRLFAEIQKNQKAMDEPKIFLKRD